MGKFIDDPNKYIESFQELTLTFELAWKDVMLILSQTLTRGKKEKVIRGALEFGDECPTINAGGKPPEELTQVLTGCQAVPFTDPEWGQDTDDADNWYRNHFMTCILEGLKRALVKPINYSKLSAMRQQEKESPSVFLERLREALVKHTHMSPQSSEGRVLLKDKFITQSAPDIRRKLQNLAFGPE